MVVQMDFWVDHEIERLLKRVATLSAELVTLREQNVQLSMKRFSKKTQYAYSKKEFLPRQLPDWRTISDRPIKTSL